LRNGLQIVKHFLLFLRIPVGCFADGLQLIFNALQCRFSAPESDSANPDAGPLVPQIFLDRLKIHRRRRRSHLVGRHDIRHRCADVSVQQGQYPLDKWQRRAQSTGCLLQSRAPLP